MPLMLLSLYTLLLSILGICRLMSAVVAGVVLVYIVVVAVCYSSSFSFLFVAVIDYIIDVDECACAARDYVYALISCDKWDTQTWVQRHIRSVHVY